METGKKPPSAAHSHDARGDARATFKEQAQAIFDEWDRRTTEHETRVDGRAQTDKNPISSQELAKPSPFASKEGYLKRESYHLIVKTINLNGGHAAIKAESDYEKRYDADRMPSYTDNRFYWGIWAIFPDFDIKTLRYYANQLEYANRHGVPAEYLIGFLLQCGNNRLLRRKISCRYTEDEFIVMRNNSKFMRNLA